MIFVIVSIAAFAIFLLIVGYIVPQITTPLAEQIGISAEINNSLNVSSNIAEHTFPTLWLILFSGLVLGLFITSFFIDTHPIFVPIFAIMLVITIVIAVPISNAYEALSEDAILSGIASQQGMIGFILLNLPVTAFILGILALLITFAKPEGGSATLS